MEQERNWYLEKEIDHAEKKAKNGFGMGLAGVITGGLALLNGTNSLGRLFGCGSNCETYSQAEIDALRSKECQDALDLTRSIYNGRIVAMQERFDDRQTINHEMFGLYKSQIDADFNLYKNQRDGFDVLANRISCLEKDVAINTAIRPYQDKLIQCEIDKAYTSSINYTNTKTCRMLEGTLICPTTPTITGVQNPLCCKPCSK